MAREVRVRFAPSPTGDLHVGSVRAALYNYLFARRWGGRFILRIEDTDAARSTSESERGICEDLRWLGMEWDEGPDRGGPHAPYRQSERTALYQRHALALLREHRAYRCFCPPTGPRPEAEVDEEAGDLPGRSDGSCPCRGTSFDEARRRSVEEPYALRFAVADRKVAIDDIVFGRVEAEVEDFVILKASGSPTYHFAVVADDLAMGISHVIRGQDHLLNTAKHLLLFRALGAEPPSYAHFSLTKGLSKRDRSQSVRGLREEGYLPEAVVNAALLLGWTPRGLKEKLAFSGDPSLPLAERIRPVVERFDPADFIRANAAFDAAKLRWLAGEHLREASEARIAAMGAAIFEARGIDVARDPARLARQIAALKPSAATIGELAERMRVFEAPSSPGPEAQAALADPLAARVLRAFADRLAAHAGAFDEAGFNAIAAYAGREAGAKGKTLFLPIRIALTGEMHGPELKLVAPILGSVECLRRLERALEALHARER